MSALVTTPLHRLLHASSVVVVGASATRDSATGNQVIRNLRAAGYEGRIEVLHPSGREIEGIPALTSLDEADPADTAVIAVGPRAVGPVLEKLHQGGVSSAIVMSVGLDDAQRDHVRDFAVRTGMAVHGPNCMGVINVADKLMLWADEGVLTDLPQGDVALISQSGSGAIFVARSMTGVGFSHVISTGNETALSTADYIDLLVDDPRTRVIGVVLESVVGADALASAVGRARAAGKPVVALKVGLTAAGAQATVAHTGAVLADGAVTTAYFRRLGVPLVEDYDELGSALELLSHLASRNIAEGRTAVITISGGQAALTADLAEPRGVTLADFSPETREQLGAILPGLLINNPLDAGGSLYAEDDSYDRALDLLARDEGVDVVMAIADSQVTLNETEIFYEDDMVAAVRAAAARYDKLFVIASSSSVSLHPSRVSPVGDAVPVVRGIGNALRAISVAAEASRTAAAAPSRPAGLPSAARVDDIRRELAAYAGAAVPGERARDLLREYGLPLVESRTFSDVEAGVADAALIGYPLVAKIDSPDISHKTEVGGVVVGIDSDQELRDAWLRIMDAVSSARPDARVAGIELQPQIERSIEALVGVISDPAIGATLAVGMGGVMVELYRDVAHALAPVDADEARRMIGETRLATLMNGYRQLFPIVDDGPLVDLVTRVSWLAADLRGLLAEFDANPVLIDPESSRVRLIDALFVLTSA